MSEQQIHKVKVKRLSHVGLWATDVLAQAHFYHQVLGLNVCSSSAASIDLEDANVFLALRDESHCLGLFNDVRSTYVNGRRPSQRTPLHHLSFEVGTDAELAALAARLKQSGVDLTLSPRDGEPELGDTLWLSDPDGNRIEISVAIDDLLTSVQTGRRRQGSMLPVALQHVALNTTHLEDMVEFYTEALGFDISDWLLRETAWLRCNNDHHTIMFSQNKPGIDHVAFRVTDAQELLRWADYLSSRRVTVLWGPGRHGAGNDLFLRFADAEGVHIELSAELQQYYDGDVTTPPRLWHTREMALNLWGVMPTWLREEIHV